jgi:myo-inositol-1(or 4)-monophosphatase
MARKVPWLKILLECKNNVLKGIKPLLRTSKKPSTNPRVGAGGDLLEEPDLEAERAIVSVLRKHEISFTLISEESGILEYGSSPSECYVTTDPIDGSTNMYRRIPFYATSIAVSREPTLISVHSALVADLFHDITYTSQKNKGSSKDGKKIIPSQLNTLTEAIIGVDLNTYRADKVSYRLTPLIKQTNHIRHFGANALELCYVADGTTDAFVDIRGKLRTTDIAAAQLVLREAGAILTTPEGNPLEAGLDPRQRISFVASGNKENHETILKLIRPQKEEKC